MCKFVSWIEKAGTVYFLTGKQVYESREGKELQNFCGSVDDLLGHGAIRHFYSLEGGYDRECDDFFSPANFPAEIVAAIKTGDMRGMAVVPKLLTRLALAEFRSQQQPAQDEYQRIERPAWEEYVFIEGIASRAYNRNQIDWPAYQRIVRAPVAEYNRIEHEALAEFQRIRQKAFWDLFANTENRAEAWK